MSESEQTAEIDGVAFDPNECGNCGRCGHCDPVEAANRAAYQHWLATRDIPRVEGVCSSCARRTDEPAHTACVLASQHQTIGGIDATASTRKRVYDVLIEHTQHRSRCTCPEDPGEGGLDPRCWTQRHRKAETMTDRVLAVLAVSALQERLAAVTYTAPAEDGDESDDIDLLKTLSDSPLWNCFICGGDFPAGHSHAGSDDCGAEGWNDGFEYICDRPTGHEGKHTDIREGWEW